MTWGRRWLLGCALAACLHGCALLVPESRTADEMLRKADALAAGGDERGAIVAYSAVANRYPDLAEGTRARILRNALQAVQQLGGDLRAREAEVATARRDLAAARRDLATREAELAAREADLVRLLGDLTARDQELGRLRGEVAARQSDVTRLSAESERLRADIDQLKRIDLRLEQEGARRR